MRAKRSERSWAAPHGDAFAEIFRGVTFETDGEDSPRCGAKPGFQQIARALRQQFRLASARTSHDQRTSPLSRTASPAFGSNAATPRGTHSAEGMRRLTARGLAG